MLPPAIEHASDSDAHSPDECPPRPLSPIDFEELEAMQEDLEWALTLNEEDKHAEAMNSRVENNVVRLDADKSSNNGNKRKAPLRTLPKRQATRKPMVVNDDDNDDDVTEDSPYEDESRLKKKRSRKSDPQITKELLEDPTLSPKQVEELRRQARMARNRASAERTRMRRLQYTATLEIRVAAQEELLKRCTECIRAQRNGAPLDAPATDRLLADIATLQQQSSAGQARRRTGFLPSTTRKSLAAS